MAKIAIGEGITKSVFDVKGVNLGEEEAPYWTTLRKRESYKPRLGTNRVGIQTYYYARKDFFDCHLPREWEIARDAEIIPFEDVFLFRRMVKVLGAIPINLKNNIQRRLRFRVRSGSGNGSTSSELEARVCIHKRIRLDATRTLQFQLEGVRHHMSWRQFILEWVCIRQRSWILTVSKFIRVKGVIPSYTSIGDPLMRLCHKLIALSNVRRSQAPKKVTSIDLFYLRSMDVGSVNIPYLLAQYLRRYAFGRKRGAKMPGGQFASVAPRPERRHVDAVGAAQVDQEVPEGGVQADLTPAQAPQTAHIPRTMPQRTVEMDDSNRTMEEYIELEAKKARRHDFPSIVFDDPLGTNHKISSEPIVSPLDDNNFDFIVSFDESNDEYYTVIYDKNSFSYELISVNALETNLKNDNDEVSISAEDVIIEQSDGGVDIDA
uniref:Uncharacterized protein n=1 Tax=Tanacetum cinerariifolium TaxID=118510 RepID=A0A6L2KYT1_TANCI|nr:hypothetical protein [Tanacetum cinerariifolium]